MSGVDFVTISRGFDHFGHFRPLNVYMYPCTCNIISLRFTAITVIEIIAVFTAFYCIFQITEDYCYFSDSHCDFHPSRQAAKYALAIVVFALGLHGPG